MGGDEGISRNTPPRRPPPRTSPKEPIPRLEEWGPELLRSLLKPWQVMGDAMGAALKTTSEALRDSREGPAWYREAQRKAMEKMRNAKSDAEVYEAMSDSAAAGIRLANENPYAPFTMEGAKGFLGQSARGREILARLPASTTMKAWDRPEDSKTLAYYNREDDVIHMPQGVDNVTAAVLSAHEMTHADQKINQKHGNEEPQWRRVHVLLQDEVACFDAQIDVWRELGRPRLNDEKVESQIKQLSAIRDKDREAYELEVRLIYREKYENP